MPTALKNATLTIFGCTMLLALGACSGNAQLSTAPGAVRGQEVQDGQNQQVEMTRQEAEARINGGNANQVGSNAEVAGKPDPSAEQGALPQGVGYSNNPGVLYDPAMGQHTYIHHVVHHVHYNGAPGDAEALNNTPPPSGYVQGRYIVPDNEDPNTRSWGGGSGFNLGGAHHIYQSGSNVVHHHYYGGTGPGARTGGNSNFGRFHPYADDGGGSIGGGFED
ncbi:MAG: hypothetical protein P8J45_09785 [Phycisphaerales bacterium]|nr:hypothetical protein [Phycisphaerales bacterium]